MPYRPIASPSQAGTIQILNTIRNNLGVEYQAAVPFVNTAQDYPKVGEVLYGYPNLANQFISALMNRIAAVRTKSALFNNPFADLKKGFLEYGETVEEVFVEAAKAREFNVELAPSREFKRTLPDVRTAFHTLNYRAQYPVTIQAEDLKRAFLTNDPMQFLLDKITNSTYQGAEYDEYLLFKYLIIKGVTHGALKPVYIGDGSSLNDAAKAFRGTSNKFTLMSDLYNENGVHTVTVKDDQYIFMDADFNADYDVNVLAAAFNMDKANFMGHLHLVDSFTTFDSDRFSEIMGADKAMEPITEDELQLMADVKAILVDKEWFQIYDNHLRFTEVFVSSGEYWNYNLNIWKTVSYSPFSNAAVFVTGAAAPVIPKNVTVTCTAIQASELATIYTLELDDETTRLLPSLKFSQPTDAASKGVAVNSYGVVVVPAGSRLTDQTGATSVTIPLEYQTDAGLKKSTGSVKIQVIKAGATEATKEGDSWTVALE